MPSSARRLLPGLLAGALTGVLLVPGAALAQDPSSVPDSSPSPQATLVPLPEPEPEPSAEPEPEPSSAPTAAAPTTPPPAVATRRARRTASPVPVRTGSRADRDEGVRPLLEPSALPEPPAPSATLPPAPAEVGLTAGPPSPAPDPAAATSSEAPEDPLVRGLRLALVGAALLGLAGVTGLYLTRERP